MRACIGRHLALAEAKVVVCALLRHFRFKLEVGTVVIPTLSVTLRPSGLLMVAVPRTL